MSDKDGGPAFPRVGKARTGDSYPHEIAQSGMTLRDYFAAHCPEGEIEFRSPKTIGAMADECVALGWITKEARDRDVVSCYTEAHRQAFRAVIRYRYADAMLKERTK